MFDRLMGGAILTHTNRVMRHDIDHALTHQSRQANGSAAIVGEDKEGATIGNEAARQRHSVHGRRHAVLAHPVVDVVAGKVVPGHWRVVLLSARSNGAGEIC